MLDVNHFREFSDIIVTTLAKIALVHLAVLLFGVYLPVTLMLYATAP